MNLNNNFHVSFLQNRIFQSKERLKEIKIPENLENGYIGNEIDALENDILHCEYEIKNFSIS